jgi:predicted Fe-Mo cluster-binding NifX family protein
MKLAIPVFRDRVSPRFDFSPEIWIVEVEKGEVIGKERIPTQNLSLLQRLEQVTANGVEKVICGGIDGFCVNQLGGRGIEVVQDVIGEAEVVLTDFLKGRLRPGFRCERKRRRRCRGKEAAWRNEG